MKHLKAKIITACLLLTTLACSEQQFGLMDQQSVFGQKVDYNNKVDVLWVVDNSNSMTQHQQKIAQQVSVFVNALRNTGMNFHMGVTTMDSGSGGERGRLLATPTGTPEVLTNSTGNLVSILQSRLQMGDGGSSIERGLESMKLALTDHQTTVNAGFRRPEAVLAIIFLTNEDDESGSSVADPVAFLNSQTISSAFGDEMWVVNFIGTTPDDPSCMTVPWTREDGLKFIELANHSDGAVASICNGDFSAALTNVQGRILSVMTEWRFPRKPLESSIKVYINGREIQNSATNGWTYHEDRQSLKFHGSGVPAVGSTIHVDYKPEGFTQ